MQFITTSLLTGEMTCTELGADDVEHVQPYFDAHDLLPPRFDGASASAAGEVNQAFATLDDPQADSPALLRAVVLLGHVPTSAALQALERHGASARAHAGIARVAAIECAGMMCAGAADIAC